MASECVRLPLIASLIRCASESDARRRHPPRASHRSSSSSVARGLSAYAAQSSALSMGLPLIATDCH